MLQTGVVPVHFDALVAEQAPHAPFGWQAGVLPPQSASAVQPRQVPVAVVQAGVVPRTATCWSTSRRRRPRSAGRPACRRCSRRPPCSPGRSRCRSRRPASCRCTWSRWSPSRRRRRRWAGRPACSRRTRRRRRNRGRCGCRRRRSGSCRCSPRWPRTGRRSRWARCTPASRPRTGWRCPPSRRRRRRSAGRPGVPPPHSLSPEQPRQMRSAGSQTGVAPAAIALARHPTQVLVDGLQTGVAPPQFAVVHALHAGGRGHVAHRRRARARAGVGGGALPARAGRAAGRRAARALAVGRAGPAGVRRRVAGRLGAAAVRCRSGSRRRRAARPWSGSTASSREQLLLLAQPSTTIGRGRRARRAAVSVRDVVGWRRARRAGRGDDGLVLDQAVDAAS